ncbi:hypothetical protein GF378_03240 [Candidatus Pacearchaeota archaeon]|nr:hypothetical protein [Candidatus Pacearchaeota archaeon]
MKRQTIKLFKEKKAISIMIGYVLLISITLVMAALVYQWMRSYVPRETIECPDGVSIYIQGVSCIYDSSAGTHKLRLNLTNNGRFDVDGYFIRSSENADAKVAGNDISENLVSGGNVAGGVVRWSNVLTPGEKAPQTVYTISSETKFIEVTPIIYQTIENKIRLVNCGKAKVKENVVCPN